MLYVIIFAICMIGCAIFFGKDDEVGGGVTFGLVTGFVIAAIISLLFVGASHLISAIFA